MSLTGPKRHLVQCKDMSEVEVKANSKANAKSMTARPEFLDTLPRPNDDGPAGGGGGYPRDPEGTWRQGSWG